MTRVLVDTNIVLDALTGRKPFCKNAEKIFLLAAEEKIQGYITASSVTDIYYLVRKNLFEQKARQALHNLFQLVMVIDVRGKDCEQALEFPIEDYEDALIATCAARAKIDYLVTRDEAFLNAPSPVRVVSPAQLLEMSLGWT